MRMFYRQELWLLITDLSIQWLMYDTLSPYSYWLIPHDAYCTVNTVWKWLEANTATPSFTQILLYCGQCVLYTLCSSDHDPSVLREFIEVSVRIVNEEFSKQAKQYTELKEVKTSHAISALKLLQIVQLLRFIRILSDSSIPNPPCILYVNGVGFNRSM